MKKKRSLGCTWHLIWLCALLCGGIYLYIRWDGGPSYGKMKERLLRQEQQEKKDSIRSDKDTVWVKWEPQDVPEKQSVIMPVEVTESLMYVTANVNGIDMRFVLDTGCSGVQLTPAELYFLIHMNKLKEEKIDTSLAVCQYADGSQKHCQTLLLDSVKIGGIKIDSIHCTVEENMDAPPLLGQSVLMGLGEVTIDYKNKKLKITR